MVDTLHEMIFHFTSSKKKAKTIMKQMVKINIKLLLLWGNGCLSIAEEELVFECQEAIQNASKIFIQCANESHQLGKFLPDLQSAIQESGRLAVNIVQCHLTGRSIFKLKQTIEFYSDMQFLSTILSQTAPFKDLAFQFSQDLQESLDRGIV